MTVGNLSAVPTSVTSLRRAFLVSLGVVLLAIAGFETIWGIQAFGWADHIGIDMQVYTAAADRVVHGQTWFLPRQLNGPYDVQMGDVLYPPIAVAFFVPFLVLPAVLYWIVPLAGLLLLGERWRPARWTWPLIALCLAFPFTPARILSGNSAIWLTLFVALGFELGWPSVFVLVKPTLAPFAFSGARHRSFWIALAAVMAISLVLPETPAYPRVLLDTRVSSGAFYAFLDVPMLLIPVIAWFGRTRRRNGRRASDAPEPAGAG